MTSSDCYPEIQAPLNPDRKESERAKVLESLGFPRNPFLPRVGGLGGVQTQQAAGLMALTCMVAEMLYEIEGARKRKRVTFHDNWGTPYDDDSVTHGWFLPYFELSESAFCELDPFGRLMGDGVPVAWIGVEVPIESILAGLDGGFGFGTHVFVEGEWDWKMIPVTDGSEAVKYWVDHDLKDSSSLYVRVEIGGRMKSALKSDLQRVIDEARKFLSERAEEPKPAGKKPSHTSR